MSTVSDVEASAIVAGSSWERMEAACRLADRAYKDLEKAKADELAKPGALTTILRDIAQVAFDRACRRCEARQAVAA